MTALHFFRSVGKRSSRVVHTHDVAGSSPAAATNPRRGVTRRCHGGNAGNCRWRKPGLRQAEERKTGRKGLCLILPSVRNVFPVARGLFLSLPRTRRDAFPPPGSGGLFLSLSLSFSLLPVPSRGCG